ncbi:hypothetical protein CEXT_421271 [Caerostris extrusa]|uniref:LAGLIDADG homing endonuclease n=1 Tax=Caerostris extrusa TaxID=172846 RepID=A0AAV4WBX8_CAEEX|nr:hypothetical protein CEXT_421271 [Caerostris extrusa]
MIHHPSKISSKFLDDFPEGYVCIQRRLSGKQDLQLYGTREIKKNSPLLPWNRSETRTAPKMTTYAIFLTFLANYVLQRCSTLVKAMSKRSHLTASEAWKVIGNLERGQTQSVVKESRSNITKYNFKGSEIESD